MHLCMPMHIHITYVHDVFVCAYVHIYIYNIYMLRLCRRLRFFAYSFLSNMGVGLIWYTALDPPLNLAADCISQKSCQWFLVHWYCILTPIAAFCHVLRQPKRRATQNHSIW